LGSWFALARSLWVWVLETRRSISRRSCSHDLHSCTQATIASSWSAEIACCNYS
jgi:hypothetical protein